MNGPELVSQLSAIEFGVAAGRFLLMIAGALLAVKHVFWFKRGYHTHAERRSHVQIRSAIEMLVGFTLFVLHAQHFYVDGPTRRLALPESVVFVWATAILLFTLVLTRPEKDRWKYIERDRRRREQK